MDTGTLPSNKWSEWCHPVPGVFFPFFHQSAIPGTVLPKAVFTHRIRILPIPLKMHKTLISAAASVPTANETSVSSTSWQNRVLFLERYWPYAHQACTVILTWVSNIDSPGLPADLPPKYALGQLPVDSCLNFIFSLFTFCTYTLRCGYIGPLHMLTVPWLCAKNWPKRDAKPNFYYFVHLLALCPSQVTLRIRPTLLSRINVLHDRPSGISLRCPPPGSGQAYSCNF